MGRGLLLAVVATSLLVTFSTTRSTQNIVAIAGDQSEYGADVLAREIARSGYEVAYRAAERGQGPGGTLADAIAAVNTIAADRPFQGGTWSAEAHAIDSLSALIRVTGTYAAESYTTEGVYDASVLAPPASPHPGPPLSPDWEYDCTAGRYVEMYTMGIGTYGSYMPSATIPIPDPGSVLSIKAQATVKNGPSGNIPHIEFSTDSGQTTTLTAPTKDHYDDWFYTVDLAPASSVTVTPAIVNPYHHYGTRSFTVYVVRDRPGFSQGGGLVEYDVWWSTTPEVSKVIEIPAAPAPRDVTVTFSLGDTSGTQWWEMRAAAGSVSTSLSTNDANRGAQAAMHQVVLRDVPGSVTTVETTVQTQGESLFFQGVTATVACTD